MRCGDRAFSSGNVLDLGEHYCAAVNDLHVSSNHSAVVLNFLDSLVGKNSEDGAAPIYEKLVNLSTKASTVIGSHQLSSELTKPVRET